MKKQWAAQELLDHWTLAPMSWSKASAKRHNQFGYGLLFKAFQRDGKFPQRKHDIPLVIVKHIGQTDE